MATIKDVAKRAGVSISTVSNIINGKGASHGDTYDRVMKTVEELKYRPNFAAQNMRSNRMRTAGVLLPSLAQPYCDIYEGILKTLDAKAFHTVLKLTDNNVALETEQLHQLSNMGMCGIIVAPADSSNPQKYRDVQEKGVPLVFVERDVKGIDCSKVLFDNATLVQETARELRSRYSPAEVALIRVEDAFSCDDECEQAFRAVFSHEADILRLPSNRNTAMLPLYAALEQRLGTVKCLLCTSMSFAQAACDAADLLRIDLEIYALGYDEWCLTNPYRHIHPIHRNSMFAGIQAAEQLSALIDLKYQATHQTVRVPSKVFHPGEPTHRSQTGGELRLLMLDCDTTDVLERLSHSARRHFGLNISFDKRPYRELKETLLAQTANATMDYDIVMIDMPWLAHVDGSGYLYDLEREVPELRKKYMPRIGDAFFRLVTRNNVIPLVSGIQAIYYRTDCFTDPDIRAAFQKRYGFELNVPRSWTEYNTVCQFFTRGQNPQSPFETGTSMALHSPSSLVHEFLPRQWSFHGALLDENGRVALDQDGNVRALNNLRETHRYAAGNQGDRNLDDEFFGLLLSGEIPIVSGFTSHFHPERHRNPDYSKFISIAPMPQGRCVLGGWALGVNRHSRRVSQSCHYLEWLLLDQVSIANMRMNGCIPTLAVHQNADLRSQYTWLNLMNDAFTKGGNREMVYNHRRRLVDNEAVDDILARAIEGALYTDADSFELLTEAKERLRELITGN